MSKWTRWLCCVSAAVLLTACAARAALPTPQSIFPTAAPTTAPTAQIVTLLPEIIPSSTPVQPSTTSSDGVDCALATGWVGCDRSKPPLNARIAFLDGTGSLTVLEGASDQAWTRQTQAVRLGWSMDGEQLLVETQQGQFDRYDAQGELLEPLSAEDLPVAQPDQTFATTGRVHSAQGDEAWIDTAGDGRAVLRVQAGGDTNASVMPLEDVPQGQIFQLIGWVPEHQAVIGMRYNAGNAALMQGGRLFRADVQNGSVTEINAYVPIGERAMFAWRADGLLLAFAESGDAAGGAPRLALWDAQTNQVTYPFPAGAVYSAAAWNPVDGRLAFGVDRSGLPQDAEAVQRFPSDGIFTYAADTGTISALMQPPTGAAPVGAYDLLPFWTGDGAALLYVRQTFADGARLEIRAHRLADGLDWAVVSGLMRTCGDRQSCRGEPLGVQFAPGQ